ncbi:hypothetical protein BKA64DRAFT_472409 [Cadophora sp. MPI-SDFR-AT-0126]|nr:hypothetical protein BKA64DRAFT_472409 [Leotiomycetes sp. MPI-SDFR-AT-0126]
MDPLTALSLASSIIQLIDFTGRVVSNCRGIYKSADGALPEHQDLELVTEDLVRLSKRQAATPWPKPKDETDAEKPLHSLSDTCVRVSNELLERLSKHKVTKGSPVERKWKSFREALETVWNKKDLEGLATRLEQLRSEMSLHILVAFKEQFDLVALQNARRFDWLDCHTKYLIKGLSETRVLIENNLDTLAAEEQHARTREVIIQAIRQYMVEETKKPKRSDKRRDFDMMKEEDLEVKDDVEDDKWAVQYIHQTFEERRKIQRERKFRDGQIAMQRRRIQREVEFRRAIMASLAFPTMESRQSSISDAHESTFDWIHDETLLSDTPWSSFQHWLSKGSGIYWINGKAGSGKSTLMRYIFEHTRTSEMLARWAGREHKVITPGFFFWNSGSPDQSSQLGLLRSLLHNILSYNEKLIPAIFPVRYQDFPRSSELEDYEFTHAIDSEKRHRWTIAELKLAFQRLLKEDVGHMCIFIDGLDEYSGDPMDTISWFKSTISRKIKICISSRPWIMFEDAFSCSPQLKLQDLTTNDIRNYIDDTLCGNERMRMLYVSEPLEAPTLVQEIISKAAGVFLWVRLVVTSLLRGLHNRDRIKDLQLRLRLLPDELESLFSYMLKSVEPIYLREGSQILRTMLKYQEISAKVQNEYPQGEGLSAIELSFAIDTDESSVIKSSVGLMEDAEVAERVADVDCRLKVRCAGLLEIPTYWQREDCPHTGRIYSTQIGEARVQWLHRTVRDYLETGSGGEVLRQNSLEADKEEFSPSRVLLLSSVLQLKRWYMNIPVVDGVHPLPGLVARSMTTAHCAEFETSQSEIKMLDELDRTVKLLYRPPDGHWVKALYRSDGQNDFISLAEKYELKHYLCDKLFASVHQPSGLSINPKKPYLNYLSWSRQTGLTSSDGASCPHLARNRRLIEIMMEKGCDPNTSCKQGVSGWHEFLSAVFLQSPLSEQGHDWASVVKLFLEHKADLTSPVMIDAKEHTPREIVINAFARNFPEECRSLIVLIPQQTLAPFKQSHGNAAGSWLARKFSRRRADMK